MSALPFITPAKQEKNSSDGDTWIVHDEALRLLKSIEYPLAVVAVAGKYRTGKSFLMNQLVQHAGGFRVGSTIEPCTKGIWLWSEPLTLTTADNEEVSVLFLDTEGLGSTDASEQHDARVFALATLLCSLLVYNSVGAIDEEALSNLSFIANLSRHIQSTHHEQGDQTEIGSLFPNFLWVLRDFVLTLEDEDGNAVTAKEYLEQNLQLQEGFSSDLQQRNRIRQTLTSFFRARDCCTLVRPLDSEKALQDIEFDSSTEFRPEFEQQLKALKEHLFGKLLVPKRIHGRAVSGRMLAQLAQLYVDAINHDAVPTIDSAWESVTKAECKSALEDAWILYADKSRTQLMQAMPCSMADLARKHFSLLKDAIQLYETHAISNNSDTNSNLTVSSCKSALLEDSTTSQHDVMALLEATEASSVSSSAALNAYDKHSAKFDTTSDDLSVYRQCQQELKQRIFDRLEVYIQANQRKAEEYAKLVFSETHSAITATLLTKLDNPNNVSASKIQSSDIVKAFEQLANKYHERAVGPIKVIDHVWDTEYNKLIAQLLPALERFLTQKMTNKVEKLSQEVDRTKQALESEISTKKSLSKEISQLRIDNTQLHVELSEARAQSTARNNRVKDLQERFNTLQTHSDNSSEDFQTKLQDKELVIARLEAEVAELRKAAVAVSVDDKETQAKNNKDANGNPVNVGQIQTNGSHASPANRNVTHNPSMISVDVTPSRFRSQSRHYLTAYNSPGPKGSKPFDIDDRHPIDVRNGSRDVTEDYRHEIKNLSRPPEPIDGTSKGVSAGCNGNGNCTIM